MNFFYLTKLFKEIISRFFEVCEETGFHIHHQVFEKKCKKKELF